MGHRAARLPYQGALYDAALRHREAVRRKARVRRAQLVLGGVWIFCGAFGLVWSWWIEQHVSWKWLVLVGGGVVLIEMARAAEPHVQVVVSQDPHEPLLGHAQAAYARGDIEVEEFEGAVEHILAGGKGDTAHPYLPMFERPSGLPPKRGEAKRCREGGTPCSWCRTHPDDPRSAAHDPAKPKYQPPPKPADSRGLCSCGSGDLSPCPSHRDPGVPEFRGIVTGDEYPPLPTHKENC